MAGARHALDIGCTTFQIMSGNPSAWDPGRLDPVQAALFGEFLDETGIRPVFLHAGYLINLSCRKGRNAPIYAKSIRLLQGNLDRAAALTCEYVVVHLGSRRGTSCDDALKALTAGLGRLKAPRAGHAAPAGKDGGTGGRHRPVLLLENSAGSGDSVGSTFEELAQILEEAEARAVAQPLGICLDTAHLWGAGYDLSSAAGARRVIAEFDSKVGLGRLHLVHLNDSPVSRGSLKDRHEHPGKGVIAVPALKAFARHKDLRHVAMILETPGRTEPTDAQRMTDLKKLAGT